MRQNVTKRVNPGSGARYCTVLATTYTAIAPTYAMTRTSSVGRPRRQVSSRGACKNLIKGRMERSERR
jgi:hypothetical protein